MVYFDRLIKRGWHLQVPAFSIYGEGGGKGGYDEDQFTPLPQSCQENGVPRGIRTPVAGVKGRCPRPG